MNDFIDGGFVASYPWNKRYLHATFTQITQGIGAGKEGDVVILIKQGGEEGPNDNLDGIDDRVALQLTHIF